MAKDLDVIQLLNNLKNIHRTGPNLFAGIPASSIESISDHSYKVTYLCVILAKYFDGVNLEKLLLNAITHDWAEAIVMDVPSGSPSFSSYFDQNIREIFKTAELKAKTEILGDIDLSLPNMSDLESIVLDFCDGVAVLFEMIDYKQKGYNHEWIDRMFAVRTDSLMKMVNEKVPESSKEFFKSFISDLQFLFEQKYMVNKYLTKATRK
jgi:5'-deoxynucleotidase YfbR-like HD superfamily hydrolase